MEKVIGINGWFLEDSLAEKVTQKREKENE